MTSDSWFHNLGAIAAKTPTFVGRYHEFHPGVWAATTKSKSYVKFVTRTWVWSDSLIGTCKLVQEHEFCCIGWISIVDVQLQIRTSDGSKVQSQVLPWLSSYYLETM